MIIEDKPLQVSKSEGLNSRKFTIALNKSLYNTLSSGIYSNPIGAIIRELSCNAWDSHIEAGKKDVPFEIHLPNLLENFFEVKDFGIGLNDEKIYEVYTQYGNSTKINSNSLIGALGIGSKSPFSYTDNFTLENRFNGIKTIYTAFISEEGFPTLSEPLSKTPTNECNGLSIKFSVKNEDINQFKSNAEEILQWFEVKPNIIGNEVVLSKPKTYLIKTDKFGITNTYNKSFVIMGNIAYPIDVFQLQLTYNEKDQNIKKVIEHGIELYVDIGDVDITANRESLSYNENKTKDFIKNTILNVIKTIEENLSKELENCPNLWEARKKNYNNSHHFNYLKLNNKWKNISLQEFTQIPNQYDTYQFTFNIRLNKVKSIKINSLYPSNIRIFYNDDKFSNTKIRNYVRTNPTEKVLIFNKLPDNDWLESTGIKYAIEKTSILPKPERKKIVREKIEKAKLYKLNTSRTYGNSIQFWQPIEIDLNDTSEFIYINIAFFNRKKGDIVQNPREIKDIVDLIEKLDKKIDIIGVKTCEQNLIKKSKGRWIELDDYIKDLKIKLDSSLKNDAMKVLDWRTCNFKYLSEFGNLSFSHQNSFTDFIKDLNEARILSTNTKLIEYLKLSKDLESNRFSSRYEDLIKKYKLLVKMPEYLIKHNYKEIYDNYISIIDKLDGVV